MHDSCESEKRHFVRVPVDVKVDYRFVPSSPDLASLKTGQTFHGHTGNVGAGGLLLVGEIPDNDLIADLLMRRVSLVVEIRLPEHQPINALARVAWLEAIDPAGQTCSMGLTFREITTSAQDELFRFIIHAVSS